MKMQKNQQLLIHVAPPLRDEVMLAAEQEGRSISDTVRRVLISWAADRIAERVGLADGDHRHAA